ncbi:MAG: hypothetical protein V2A34_16205, partial [Lentisphaerota bacterium]
TGPLQGPKLTNFNKFYVSRMADENSEGLVLVDNAHVEAFPTNVVAWWRFDEYDLRYADDAVGSYFPERRGKNWATNANPADSRIYSDGEDVPNYEGRGGFIYTNMVLWRPIQLGTNWTLEAFVGRNAGSNATQLIALGEYVDGEADTNALISVSIRTNLVVECLLRDSGSTDNQGDYFGSLFTVPGDQAWHHLALVKSGAVLRCYLDYSLVSSNAMTSDSDGEYMLRADHSKVNLGMSFDLGSITTRDTEADEIRLSSAALPPSKFLHVSSPRILSIVPRDAGGWYMFFESPFHPNYDIEAIADLGGGSWADTTAFVVTTGHISRVTVPTLPEGAAFRLRRDLQGD